MIPRENLVDGSNAAAITTTTPTAIIAAPGAGLRICITDILITNSSTTTATVVKILSGTTLKWQGYARTEGGFSLSLGMELVCGVNEAVNVECVTTGSSIFASISGYKTR